MTTKKLIYVDETKIKTSYSLGTKQQGILNDFIKECEKECRTSFNDEEKLQLKKNAGNFLKEWVKPQFQFPHATDEFNVQALGIDIDTLTRKGYTQGKEWNKYPYLLEEGQFIYDEQSVIDKHTHYAENEFQEDCVEIANELLATIEKGIALGVLSKYDSIPMSQGFRVLQLSTSRTAGKDHNIAIATNIKYINKINN